MKPSRRIVRTRAILWPALLLVYVLASGAFLVLSYVGINESLAHVRPAAMAGIPATSASVAAHGSAPR